MSPGRAPGARGPPGTSSPDPTADHQSVSGGGASAIASSRGAGAGAVARSRGSWPNSASASRAASGTDRANTPTVSRLGLWARIPVRGIAPKLGLKPTTPQKAAGRITEPAVWVPTASGAWPAATAAAEPDDEPPGVCPGAAGLRVGALATAAVCGVAGLTAWHATRSRA